MIRHADVATRARSAAGFASQVNDRPFPCKGASPPAHITVLELLDRLCRYHHRLKTTNGWALVDGTGKRDFVPPEDPRHPRYAKARSVRGGTGATEDGPGGGPRRD